MRKILIKCKCGHVREITFNHFINGNVVLCKECSNKHLSEQELYVLLKKRFSDIEFQHVIFTNRYQWIDYFVPSKNIAIEYHGEQHYTWCKWFHRSYEDFIHAIELDKIKEEWCISNGIKYVVVDGRKWNKKNFNSDDFVKYLDILFL